MNKTLSLLGICRKAGKLSVGHDMVFQSVRKGKAKLVVLTKDASPRHSRELEAAEFAGSVITLEATADIVGPAIGKRCCIFAVEDDGFAKAIEKTV